MEWQSAPTHEADVVVYGDASGGVTAAVQAARMGKSVILVSQYGHLGGMTSSGLGWTDLGNDRILGGLSREFYHRLYLHYQKPAAWVYEKRDKSRSINKQVDAHQHTGVFSCARVEPSVVEAVRFVSVANLNK